MRKPEPQRPCRIPPFVGVGCASFLPVERGVSLVAVPKVVGADQKPDVVSLGAVPEVVGTDQKSDVLDACVGPAVVGDDATIFVVSIAVSVEGGAVMPIMNAYCEATLTGRSPRSLDCHCTVTWSCSIHSSGGSVVYTSVVDMFGSRRNAIGVVIADVQRYSSSTDSGENPLALSITGL